MSKAAVNTIGARIAFEEKGKIIILMLHPGAVETDMLIVEGMDVPAILKEAGLTANSAQKSANILLKSIEAATHEDSGKSIDSATGEVIPW